MEHSSSHQDDHAGMGPITETSDITRLEGSRSILDLPPDILVLILKQIHYIDKSLGHDCEPHSLIHQTLARLCSQFRTLVNSIPLFWSVISTSWNKNKLQEFIVNSGDALVDIRLICEHVTNLRGYQSYLYAGSEFPMDEIPQMGHLRFFVKEVIPAIASRCKYMRISARGDAIGRIGSTLSIIQYNCPSVHFPVLKVLRLSAKCGVIHSGHAFGMDIPAGFDDEAIRDGIHRYSVDAINGWSMPQLRELSTRSWIPRLLPEKNNLQIIRINILAIDTDCRISYNNLAALLSSCASTLHTLALTMDEDSFEEIVTTPPWKGKTTTLPELVQLLLDFRRLVWSMSDLPHLLTSFAETLRVPALQRLYLLIDFNEKSNTDFPKQQLNRLFYYMAKTDSPAHPLREAVFTLSEKPDKEETEHELSEYAYRLLKYFPRVASVYIVSNDADAPHLNGERPDDTEEHVEVSNTRCTFYCKEGLIEHDIFMQAMEARMRKHPRTQGRVGKVSIQIL